MMDSRPIYWLENLTVVRKKYLFKLAILNIMECSTYIDTKKNDVILFSGTGKMFIDDETQKVSKGDSIFIPSIAMHGIKNIGKDILTYLTLSAEK